MTQNPQPEAPEGFVQLPRGLGFSDQLAPLFVRRDGDSPPRMGLYVEAQHCNPAGVCGGGLLASILDHALGAAVMHAMQSQVPPATVSLHTDFVAPGRLGHWLETETLSASCKGPLGYATVVLRGPDGVVAQGTGVCKIQGGDRR